MDKLRVKTFIRNTKDYHYTDDLDEVGRDTDDYCYTVYINLYEDNDDRTIPIPASMWITRFGVSIEHRNGSVLRTPLVPKNMFPEALDRLTEDQLAQIVDAVEASDFEGHLWSKERMDEIYQEYLEEKNGNDPTFA